MGFWERATLLGVGADPIDTKYCGTCLVLYAHDLGGAALFARDELAFSASELVEVNALLATRPNGLAHLRMAWAQRITAAIDGGRLALPGLDSVAAVKATLGV